MLSIPVKIAKAIRLRAYWNAKADGLFCSRCPTFSLKWVYPWILDASWKEIMSG